MIRRLHDRDVFTMVYVCSPEDAAEMAAAGADVVCAHVGTTEGGLAGSRKARPETAELLRRSEAILEAAEAVNDEIISLVHGGPFADPDRKRCSHCVRRLRGSPFERRLGKRPVGLCVPDRTRARPLIPMVRGRTSLEGTDGWNAGQLIYRVLSAATRRDWSCRSAAKAALAISPVSATSASVCAVVRNPL